MAGPAAGSVRALADGLEATSPLRRRRHLGQGAGPTAGSGRRRWQGRLDGLGRRHDQVAAESDVATGPGGHTARPQLTVDLVDALAPYRKALYPFGAALLGLGAALLPFTDGGTTITNAEWSAFGAAIAAAGVVWVAPKNKPKKRKGETSRDRRLRESVDRKRRRKGEAGRRAVERARR